jgi:hypothetical protein
MRPDAHQCREALNSLRLHTSGRQGNTVRMLGSLIRKLHAYTLHPSGRHGNIIQTRSCYGNYMQTKCNRPNSRATPFGRGLNMETRGVRYGKLVAQKTVQTLNASVWMPIREIRDRLVLGFLSLYIEASRHVFFTEFGIEFCIA